MPRYVILAHDYPELHWDFMLEFGDILKTWRLFEKPSTGTTVSGELSFDHRLKYLNYEGPISGDRGSVLRQDCGTYIGDLPKDFETTSTIRLELRGDVIQGEAIFRSQEKNRWTISFR